MNGIKEYKDESVVLPKYDSLDTRFKEALEIVDDIVLKNYITKLRDLQIIPLSSQELSTNIPENVRFFKMMSTQRINLQVFLMHLQQQIVLCLL